MLRLRCLDRVVAATTTAVMIVLLPLSVNAEPLTTRDALLISSSQSQDTGSGFWDSFNIGPDGLGASDPIETGSISSGDDQPTGAVIGIGEGFGVIIDYSSDMPRFRGLSFSPNDSVRFEASGELNTGSDQLGGRVSVHFNF